MKSKQQAELSAMDNDNTKAVKNLVAQTLHDLDIDFRAVEHPAVFTVSESKKHLPEKVPVKSLLLREKRGDKFVLAIVPGDRRLDTKEISRIAGTKSLMFARPEELKQMLGVTPGSVSLFSLVNDSAKNVLVVIEEKLLKEREIGFHPNDNTSTFFIEGKDIKKFILHAGNKFFVQQLQ